MSPPACELVRLHAHMHRCIGPVCLTSNAQGAQQQLRPAVNLPPLLHALLAFPDPIPQPPAHTCHAVKG